MRTSRYIRSQNLYPCAPTGQRAGLSGRNRIQTQITKSNSFFLRQTSALPKRFTDCAPPHDPRPHRTLPHHSFVVLLSKSK